MANIIISGSALTLKSAIKLDDLKKLAKYDPAALEMRDEKDRLIFKVSIAGEGHGSVAEKAIFFAPVTHDPDGLATVNLAIPGCVKDAKDYVADMMGSAYPKLVELEGTMESAVAAVDAAKEQMLENITVQ